MEDIYKLVSRGIKNTFYSIISILKAIVISKFNTNIPLTKNDDLLVIANGPSFTETFNENTQVFQNVDCIVTNTFAVSSQFEIIKPKYYLWLDAYMWTNEVNVSVLKTHEVLMHKVNWPILFFIPQFAKKVDLINKIIKSNTNITPVIYNYTYFNGFTSLGHKLFKQNLCTPRAWNVSIISLFLGINMRYKNIYLVGADHTWHQNLYMSKDNVLHTKVEHFFDKKDKVEYVPFYKAGDKKNGTNTASDFFLIWAKTFEGYEKIRDYANYRRVNIYNASSASFIDAFEREDLSKIST